MGKIANISVFDYDREKICDLYDSQNDMPGSAYNIDFVKNYNGVHTLSFSLPYKVGNEINFRWQYMQSDYMIRLHYNGKNEWFVASKPQKSKDKSGVIGVVKCNGIPALLKTKNIYSEFDDENGIGTIRDLMPKVLAGSGWRLGYCDIVYEKDGTTEKVRSLKSSGKKGALDLINTLCNLFRCRPEYDTENLTVNVYAITNRDQFFEGEVGRNLNALSVAEDSENIATRLYVEGEYGENGYIGIDDVNPTGLNYIMNFDYYRKIGVFKQRHETALQNYLADIQEVNSRIKASGQLINQQNDAINNQIGQCDLVLYYVSTGFTIPAHVYGNPSEGKKPIGIGDHVVVLNSNGTFRYEEVITTAESLIQSGDYGIAKFVTPAAGIIGSQEVQIEAKETQIENLQRKINATTKQDKIAEYRQEIEELNNQIEAIYTAPETGLYARMSDVMKVNGMLEVLDDYLATLAVLRLEQDEVEATFIVAMGSMLRDGYWQNNNYALGQEQALYDDATEVCEQISKPVYKYSLDYIRSSPVMQPMYYAYYSATDPTLNTENIVRPGDFWVKSEPDQTLWSGVLLKTWQEMKSIQWGSVKCYRRTASNTWVLITDMNVQEPDLSEHNDIPIEEIHINAIMRINDDDLDIHENMFIESVTIGIDKDNYGTLNVSNNDLSLNTNDLGSLLSRMSQLADLIDQKNQVYERAKAFSTNGMLYADRLNGQIDVLKNQLLSTVSNWRTDEQGNILFEAVDGGSAMMLCGAGFMIANSKNEDGSWNWRTFGTGEGFTADEIVAGFISAERIEAGSIATSKLTPDVGNTLVISGNPAIVNLEHQLAPEFDETTSYAKGQMVYHDGHLYVFTVNHPAGAWNENHVVSSSMSAQIELLPDQIIEYVGEQGYNKTYIQATDPALDADKHVTTGDYWIKKAHAKMTWGDVKGTSNVWNNYRTGQWADLYIGISEIYCRNASGQWIQVYNTDIVATAYTQIRQTQFEITQEAYRANAAEGELQSRIRQTADQISMEVSRATAAENSKIAKTGIYQTAEAIVTEAVRQSASDAQQSYIAKTGIYQDADSIVSEAYRQATTTAGQTYIAKTDVYQTADAIMQEAVKTSAVNVAPPFLATKAYAIGDVVSYQGNVYRFKTAHPAGAWNASHVDQTNLNNASSLSYIAKTSQYQTADEIVSKAEAYTDGELTSYSTTTQTSNMISAYVTDNAYGLVSGITINASGIEISGSKYLKMKSGGYIEVNSGGKIDIKSGASFTVASGNFNIDSSGNVSITGAVTATSGSFTGTVTATSGSFTGTVNATSGSFTGTVNATSGSFTGTITSKSGSIGSWNIADSWLYTGSGTTCVTLVGAEKGNTSTTDWNLVKDYAMYAGGSWPNDAYFKVKKDGTVYLNKLMIWDGSAYVPVDFSKDFSNAVSYSSGSWNGEIFTANLSFFNGVATKSISCQASINVDSVVSKSVYPGLKTGLCDVNIRLSPGGTAITENSVQIDGTVFYDAGYRKGSSDGAAAVTLEAAGWVGGSNVVSASNGKSVRVNLPRIMLSGGTSFSGHKTTVNASGGGASGPVASLEVDATSEYNAGVADGEAKFTSHTGFLRGSSVTARAGGTVQNITPINANSYVTVSGTKYYAAGTTLSVVVGAGDATTYYTSGNYLTYYTKDT